MEPSAWLALGLLGAFHGLNPGTGWLFAVSRGLQEGHRREVVRSLWPIALGHELAIGVTVVLVVGLEAVTDPAILRGAGAAMLVGFGLFKVLKPRSHPKWVGMRVSRPELAVWSFLMSSAHGAGLMLFPILIGAAPAMDHHAGQAMEIAAAGLSGAALGVAVLALTVHLAAVVVVMGAVALLVYDKLGLAILRKAWVNLDLVWAGALVTAGAFTLFTS
jgi:hypothetical protein